jgi:D-beta-D-heptose 7-phosphate kinase/D-beta-D-heptose 1-phosphate adenosyltransferase
VEAELATGKEIHNLADARRASRLIQERFGFPAVLLKLDRDGMFLMGDNGEGLHIPARAREVYDITGAGDMVLAVLGIALASELSLRDAAILANLAAGIEVDRVGVACVSRLELVREASNQAHAESALPLPVDLLGQIVESYHSQGKHVVLLVEQDTTLIDCPIGHLRSVEARGDVLIVAVSMRPTDAVLAHDSVRTEAIFRLLKRVGCVHHIVLHDLSVDELVSRARAHVVVRL